MIKVNDLVIFNPFDGDRAPGSSESAVKVIGTVVFVNESHRYFTVEYINIDGDACKISYRFDNIGTKVELLIPDFDDHDVSGLFEED